MNVVIPMAGFGERFKRSNYSMIKPLIKVNDKETMIEKCISSMNIPSDAKVFFIIRKNCENQQELINVLSQVRNSLTILLDQPTRGAAETVLTIQHDVWPQQPLVIGDCDMIYKWGNAFWDFINDNPDLDGAISCIKGDSPACSYAVENIHGKVIRTAEKMVISDNRITGVHYYKRAGDFIANASIMIEKNIKANGEFYISPVWNQFIENVPTCNVKIFHGKKEWFCPVGTPEDLDNYRKEHGNS